MEFIDGRYPVFLGGRTVGEAAVQRRGVYTFVCCRADAGPGGVLRLRAVSEASSAPLGVMMPRNGGLCLEKRLSRRELNELGPGRVLRFELSGGEAPEGWAWYHGEPLFDDELLRERTACLTGALTRRAGELRELAVPWSPDAPFPLMALFCLGRWREIGGRGFLVFAVRDGVPVIGPERSPASSRRDPR